MFRVILPHVVSEIKNHVINDKKLQQKSIILKNNDNTKSVVFAFFGFTADQSGIKLGMFYENAHGLKKMRPVTAYIRASKECRMLEDSIVYSTVYKLLAHRGEFSLDVCTLISTVETESYKSFPNHVYMQQVAKRSG